MEENRSALLAASTTRIATLEAPLEKGARKTTPNTISRFGDLLSARLRDDDPTLRKAYLRMLVSNVTVSKDQVIISGPKAMLENGVSNGIPRLMGTLPIFDREWCPGEDSNLHALASAST
jgi:site-specific DNA recombinase